MATIKDVARFAEVSISTVSLALNNDPRVKPSTRTKILEAAKALQYRPNGIARDLKVMRTETVCILLHDLGGPFYSELLRGLQDVATAHGYNTIASSATGGKNGATARLLSEHRVDGIIVLAPDIDDDVIAQAGRAGLPVVVLDRNLVSENVFQVLVDNEGGAYQATRHLLELGHREIGFISGPSDSFDNQLRYQGYCRALRSCDVQPSKRFEIMGRFTEDGGYLATKSILAQGIQPTAFFAANDEMAIGSVKAFQEHGLRVPQDVAIIGFDNIRLAEYVQPPLSTVRQPMYETGAVAAHILFRALQSEPNIQPVLLPTEFIRRQSSGELHIGGDQAAL